MRIYSQNVMHEPIMRIISNQLDIKLGQFTQEELDSVLRKIKNRSMEDQGIQHCNAVYNQNTIDRWKKGMPPHLPWEGQPQIGKNYQGITLTSIAAKIYNALLRNHIGHKSD